ncbi:MAG TPA: phosphoribosylformylglycinamidine synthase subunit PurQ [Candidatus Peribacterales bacterium]|nr:phosphoribosylformylglycinamidine synthase subunit PurQ [Candidatus Peribacterales bacterium]
MEKPRIAIISFPGTNGDTENLRTMWRCGFDAFVFRWNDDREKLRNVNAYFIGAGFAYEDRGRAGMVAGRDSLFQFLHEEAAMGKVIAGNCNGCQVLVESELIPLGTGLRMCMARNATQKNGEWRSPGFLNEWVWVTPSCKKDRCAASDWEGAMHIPMAHGEGRFITKDPDLFSELEANDQIAFRYCDEHGVVSDDPSVTLNGSTKAIAGICNPAGNVVALMPHPERTVNGDPYFISMRKWIERKHDHQFVETGRQNVSAENNHLSVRSMKSLEIFIDTIIVNNEERTVEQAGKRVAPALRLKQFRYMAPMGIAAEKILTTISMFNPNKEIAYVRENGTWRKWNAEKRIFEPVPSPLQHATYLRRDEPDVGSIAVGGGETGVCYSCTGVTGELPLPLKEIFANPHASTLERFTV